MRLRSRKTAGDIAPKLHVTGIHVYSCVYLSIHVGTTAFFQITAHICATRAKFRFEFFDILVNIRTGLFTLKRPGPSFLYCLYLTPGAVSIARRLFFVPRGISLEKGAPRLREGAPECAVAGREVQQPGL